MTDILIRILIQPKTELSTLLAPGQHERRRGPLLDPVPQLSEVVVGISQLLKQPREAGSRGCRNIRRGDTSGNLPNRIWHECREGG